MPCGEKTHIVREKWERRRKLEQEEIERQRRELTPLPDNWPMPKTVDKPVEIPNVQR